MYYNKHSYSTVISLCMYSTVISLCIDKHTVVIQLLSLYALIININTRVQHLKIHKDVYLTRTIRLLNI